MSRRPLRGHQRARSRPVVAADLFGRRKAPIGRPFATLPRSSQVVNEPSGHRSAQLDHKRSEIRRVGVRRARYQPRPASTASNVVNRKQPCVRLKTSGSLRPVSVVPVEVAGVSATWSPQRVGAFRASHLPCVRKFQCPERLPFHGGSTARGSKTSILSSVPLPIRHARVGCVQPLNDAMRGRDEVGRPAKGLRTQRGGRLVSASSNHVTTFRHSSTPCLRLQLGADRRR